MHSPGSALNKGILTINSGSSSLKFALFTSQDNQLQRELSGQIEPLGPDAKLCLNHQGSSSHSSVQATDPTQALQALFTTLEQQINHCPIKAIGHRVVHGGDTFHQPTIINDQVLSHLRTLTPLAPLHQPHNLSGIDAVKQLHPQMCQVACFDTAFHHTLSPLMQSYALPKSIRDQGIRRYGFHGLAYQSVVAQLSRYLGEACQGRIILAHLGNGASLCAIKEGKSVATTMGYTPLEGLPMGTRCGNVDPGILLHLLKQGMSLEQLDHLLNFESGLLGLSDISADMRTLLASDSPEAQQAIDYFAIQCAMQIASLATTLDGVDGLVFSGGIGEHADAVREAIIKHLNWLGIELDKHANSQHQQCISTAQSRITAWVVPCDEEQIIAQQTQHLLMTIKA